MIPKVQNMAYKQSLLKKTTGSVEKDIYIQYGDVCVITVLCVSVFA